MSDIISDGQPFETPEKAADQQYARNPPTWGRALGSLFQETSTTGALMRATERGSQAGSSRFDQALFLGGQSDAGQAGVAIIQPEQTPMLTAAEANKRYAPEGTKITDSPMPEGLAQVVGRQKAEEVQRESVLSRFATAHSWPVRFGAGSAAFILDPLNAASAFVPGLGEETVGAGLARVGLGTGIAARTTARVVAGGVTGAVAQAPLSAAKYALGREQASDYDLRQAFTDMAYSAAGGAAFHAGLGGLHDVVTSRRGNGSASASTDGGPPGGGGGLAVSANSPTPLLPLVRNLERSGDNAISPKGALGRYQIMPDTARQYGFDPTQLHDPAYNERAAREILGDLQHRYSGDTEAVLIAYNAGPGRANKWIKAGRDDSVLPAETQKYLDHARNLGGMNVLQGADAATKMGALRSAVSQIADGREVDVQPVFAEAHAQSEARGGQTGGDFDPAVLADTQKRLYGDGYAPGVAQSEFDGLRAKIYGDGAQARAPGDVVEPAPATQETAVVPSAERPASANLASGAVPAAEGGKVVDLPQSLGKEKLPGLTIGGRSIDYQQARELSRADQLPSDKFLVADTRKADGFEGIFPTKEAAEKFIADHPNGKFLDYDTPAGWEKHNPTGPETGAYTDQALRERIGGAIDTMRAEKAGALAPNDNAAPGGAAGKPGDRAVPEAIAAAASPADRELADLEAKFSARGGIEGAQLLPEERAELQSSAEGVTAADLREQAYAQAAQCLAEAGV